LAMLRIRFPPVCIVVFSLLCGRFLISLLFYQRLFLSQERCDNRSDGGDIRFCAAKSKLVYLCISHKQMDTTKKETAPHLFCETVLNLFATPAAWGRLSLIQPLSLLRRQLPL